MEHKSDLSILHLGLTGAIFWGVGLFFITILSTYFGYAEMLVDMLIEIYPGYDRGLLGSFFGLFYGALDGFICFSILGFIYNKLSKCQKL